MLTQFLAIIDFKRIFMPTPLPADFKCAKEYEVLLNALMEGNVDYIESFIANPQSKINVSLNEKEKTWTSFALVLYLYRRELDSIKKQKYQELLLLLIKEKPNLKDNSCIQELIAIENQCAKHNITYDVLSLKDDVLILILSLSAHLNKSVEGKFNIYSAYLYLKAADEATSWIQLIINNHLADCSENEIFWHILLNLIPFNHANQLEALYKVLENKSVNADIRPFLDGINHLYGIQNNLAPNPRKAIKEFERILTTKKLYQSSSHLLNLIARYHLALLPETSKQEYAGIIFDAAHLETQYNVLTSYQYYSIAQRSHILQLQSSVFSLANNNEEKDVQTKQLLTFFTAEMALPRPNIDLFNQYFNLLHEKIISRKEIFLKPFIDMLKEKFHKEEKPHLQKLYASKLKIISAAEIKYSHYEAYAKKSIIECNVLNISDPAILKQAADEYQEVLNLGIGSYTFLSKLYNRLGNASKGDKAIAYYITAALSGEKENLLLAARIAITLPARFQNALSFYETVAQRYIEERSPNQLIKLKDELININQKLYDGTGTLERLIFEIPKKIKKVQELIDRDSMMAISSNELNIDTYKLVEIKLKEMLATYPDGEMNNLVRERLNATKQQINAIEFKKMTKPYNIQSLNRLDSEDFFPATMELTTLHESGWYFLKVLFFEFVDTSLLAKRFNIENTKQIETIIKFARESINKGLKDKEYDGTPTRNNAILIEKILSDYRSMPIIWNVNTAILLADPNNILARDINIIYGKDLTNKFKTEKLIYKIDNISPVNTTPDETIAILPLPTTSSSSTLPATSTASYMPLSSSSAASASSSLPAQPVTSDYSQYDWVNDSMYPQTQGYAYPTYAFLQPESEIEETYQPGMVQSATAPSSSSSAIITTLQNRITESNMEARTATYPIFDESSSASSISISSMKASESAASSMETPERYSIPMVNSVSNLNIRKEQQKKKIKDTPHSSSTKSTESQLTM